MLPQIQPSVSILISVHNGENTLDRCFDSIRKQTLQDYQIVCIDDASSDGTASKLISWKNIFGPDRFILISNKENIGLTRSLNKGLQEILTPYTARIDADDWWESSKLEKQALFLNENKEYSVVGTNYINHAGQTQKKIYVPETDKEIRKTFFWRNPFAHSSVMFRTDSIKTVGQYNTAVPYSQDYELWVRCFPKVKFHNLQEFLCHRSLGSGISVEKQNEQMRLYLKVLREYLPKYQRPFIEYLAMIEPLIVLLLPNWVKQLKRRYLL